jgi:tetratricopeptide (TPR) repeat protein
VIGLAIIAFGVVVLGRQLRSVTSGAAATTLAPRQSSAKVAQLREYADRLYAERKWLAAEKAYLGVLKVDHKDVTAYSHLGIIYSTQKNQPDAIECFQMAVRLHPSGVTYQNLALSFFDNHNYIKSIAAYEKAIMFEPTAQRYVGLSKAQARLHNSQETITALEKATELDPSKRILHLLADEYDSSDRKADALRIYRRIHELDPADATAARKIGIVPAYPASKA